MLARHLPVSATHIQEVNYGNSPSGESVFRNKGLLWHNLDEESLQGRRVHDKHQVLVAVPPPGKDKLKILFRYLYRHAPRWAVWCPLRVLHSSAFREPDFQVLVSQGCQGSGAHKGAIPSRGVWVTHGLLTRNIIKTKGATSGSATDLARACRLTTAQADWVQWQTEAQPSASEADGFLYPASASATGTVDTIFGATVTRAQQTTIAYALAYPWRDTA